MAAMKSRKFNQLRQDDRLSQFVITPAPGWPSSDSVGDLPQYVHTLVNNLYRWTTWDALQNLRRQHGLCLFLHVTEAADGAGLYTVHHYKLDQAESIALEKLKLRPEDTQEALKYIKPAAAGDLVVLALIERTKHHRVDAPSEPPICSTIALL